MSPEERQAQIYYNCSQPDRRKRTRARDHVSADEWTAQWAEGAAWQRSLAAESARACGPKNLDDTRHE